MKQKLPIDTRILGCAQGELAMKKQMLDQMDRMDERYAANIEKMTQNMEKLTSSIADGFAILNQMMCQQVQPMAQPMAKPTTMCHPQAYVTQHCRNSAYELL